MNELILETLRLLLVCQNSDRTPDLADLVDAQIGRIDAALAVMRADRERENPADFVQVYNPVNRKWAKLEVRTGLVVAVSEEEFPGIVRYSNVSREATAVPVEGEFHPRWSGHERTAAEGPPHRWHQERKPFSGGYAYWCDGCNSWVELGELLPPGPCPGRASGG